MIQGKKAFIFTFAAMIIILFIVTYFSFKSESDINADLDNDNYRVNKMNRFLRDFFEIHLPVAIESSALEAFGVMTDNIKDRGAYISDFDCEFSHAFTYGNYDFSTYENDTFDHSIRFDISNDTYTEDFGDDDENLDLIDTNMAVLQPFTYNDDFEGIESLTLYGRVMDFNATVRAEIREHQCGHVAGGYLYAFERHINMGEQLHNNPLPLVHTQTQKLEENRQYYLLIKFFEEKSGETPTLRLQKGPDNFFVRDMITQSYRTAVPDEDALGMLGTITYLAQYMQENMRARVSISGIENITAHAYQTDYFTVNVSTNISMIVEVGDTYWNITNETVTASINIELLRDPLFSKNRYIQEFSFLPYGKLWFNSTDSRIFSDFISPKGAGEIASYVRAPGMAPSYLERFKGLSNNPDGFGIVSIISTYFAYPEPDVMNPDGYSDIDHHFALATPNLELYQNVSTYDPKLIVNKEYCNYFELTCTCADPPLGKNITAC